MYNTPKHTQIRLVVELCATRPPHTRTHTPFRPSTRHSAFNVYIIFDINHLRGQYILHKVALIKSLNARYHIFQKARG